MLTNSEKTNLNAIASIKFRLLFCILKKVKQLTVNRKKLLLQNINTCIFLNILTMLINKQ